MKKWAKLEIAFDVVAAVAGVLSLFAAFKKDEDLDDRVRRLILEDNIARRKDRRYS